MRRRCRNPRDPKYPRYGGRGIQICSRWDDYPAFLADMGRKPSRLHTIDRIDNDGNYEPSNCRWATAQEQVHHRVRYVEIDGRRLSKSEFLAEIGISTVSFYKRSRKGETPQQIADHFRAKLAQARR